MKKLLLLTILIGGCATAPPALETSGTMVVGKCKVDNRNKYWGDCYIKSMQADKNWSKVYAYLLKDYPKTAEEYKLTEYLNNDLVNRLASNDITIEDANKEFQMQFDNLRNVSNTEINKATRKKELERQQAALAWQQLGQALSESTAMLNQNNPNYNQNNTAPKNSGYLKDEYVSGFNKVCIYEGISGTFTINISSVGICPLSAKQ